LIVLDEATLEEIYYEEIPPAKEAEVKKD